MFGQGGGVGVAGCLFRGCEFDIIRSSMTVGVLTSLCLGLPGARRRLYGSCPRIGVGDGLTGLFATSLIRGSSGGL